MFPSKIKNISWKKKHNQEKNKKNNKKIEFED